MTRKEIELIASNIGLNNPDTLSKDILHISDMLEGIQEYIMTGNPTSKFIQLCGDENWDYASSMGDRLNKEVLEKTQTFQNFVNKVKTSTEYISKMRNEKLNNLGI